MLNCTEGTIDDSNFGKPMPIIGVYIAGATVVCTFLLFIDLVMGFKSKQYWIPANWFSINAASLTVIGVAIKLSVDLNSSMPSKLDQIAKLATSAFMCVVLANYVPCSLGKLKKGERRANTIALVLIIVTSAVNLCIQQRTGVIHAFRGAHIFMIVLMFVFLVMCFTSSTSLSSVTLNLQLEFEKVHQQALEESFGGGIQNIKDGAKLKDYLKKFSVMAYSGCPHFYLIRSPVCIVVAVFGLLSALALVFAAFATIFHGDKIVGLNRCSGESDYGWSVSVILVTQAIAILMGLVAPLSRMTYFIMARAVGGTFSNNLAIEALPLLLTYTIFPVQAVEKVCTTSHHPNNGLGPYFLHSKEEGQGSIDFMLKRCSGFIQKYIDAEEVGSENLLEFLRDKLSNDFGGVLLFESDFPPMISHSNGPPTYSWVLPVTTLICVAAALPHPSQRDLKLMKGIMLEGIEYVKLVDDILNGIDESSIIGSAAVQVESGFDLFWSWLGDVKLDELSHKCEGPKEAVSLLAESAKRHFSIINVNGQEQYDFDTDRPYKAFAAHSMYKICITILQYYENNHCLSEDGMFDMLCTWIADILGACFTNLRECIFQACKRSTIEDRRETAGSSHAQAVR